MPSHHEYTEMSHTGQSAPSNRQAAVRGVREDWFPTSIWYFDLPAAEPLNAQLLEFILGQRQRDPQGMNDRSSVLGWHSIDDMHRRRPFAPLVASIERNVDEVVNFNRWDRKKVRPGIINCWAIVNDKHASNTVHNHPQSILSGVYYVAAPENGGDLFFRDPRDAPSMVAPPVSEYTPWTFQKVVYKARVGRMLIFPSWLLHGVEPNMSDEPRVCVSFNIGVVPVQ
jgi:uncharacterized protein (TIGR02466 family)